MYGLTRRERCYRQKVRSIVANIRNRKNRASLLHRLRTGGLTPEELASATPDELFPELWRYVGDVASLSIG